MAETRTTESVLKKHGLRRELAGPLADPIAIKLRWQDMQIEKLRAENQKVRDHAAEVHRLNNELTKVTLERDALKREWQPIETAPTDGRQILTYRKALISPQSVAFWAPEGYWAMSGGPRLLSVTHWMPLPRLPPDVSTGT